MRTRRTIFLILGIVFILLQLISYAGMHIDPSKDTAYNVGYMIGSHLFLILGLVFFWVAYRTHKKIKARANQQMLDEFLK